MKYVQIRGRIPITPPDAHVCEFPIILVTISAELKMHFQAVLTCVFSECQMKADIENGQSFFTTLVHVVESF